MLLTSSADTCQASLFSAVCSQLVTFHDTGTFGVVLVVVNVAATGPARCVGGLFHDGEVE